MTDVKEIANTSKEVILDFFRKGLANIEELPKVEQVFQIYNQEILSHLPEIQEVMDLWYDKASQLQYGNFLKFKLINKISNPIALKHDPNVNADMVKEIEDNLLTVIARNGLKAPILPNNSMVFTTWGMQQYRYPKWIEVSKDDVFLDCGACVGDTDLWVLAYGAQVYSFEPVGENFDLLKQFLEINSYNEQLKNCFQMGVGEKNEEMTIHVPEELTAGSFVGDGDPTNSFQQKVKKEVAITDYSIQIVRLDDFLSERNIEPTFIKMDIEGSELSALKGAAETIKTYKPKLTICLYHKDRDLWEIPLYIKSLVPEYKFFCRENALGSEFILYATTGEKQN